MTDRSRKLGLLVEAAGLFHEAALGFGRDSDSSPRIYLPAMWSAGSSSSPRKTWRHKRGQKGTLIFNSEALIA